jgi:hypothetical protein
MAVSWPNALDSRYIMLILKQYFSAAQRQNPTNRRAYINSMESATILRGPIVLDAVG